MLDIVMRVLSNYFKQKIIKTKTFTKTILKFLTVDNMI